MEIESLAAALEREHHEIDEGIEAFTAEPVGGKREREPLVRAVRALRRHIYLEEEFLFPALHAAGLMAPVMVMLREHAEMWGTLDALDEAADDDAALTLCRRLNVQLLHHNMKEEKILYPELERVVPAPQEERLRAFLRTGEMPADWVCVRVRG
ncbi:hemerythrin domain-containing protein [Actinomadura sp. NAK00032]|uniref:hemerythrin domain-containing protein n=1 Tax=Actinomadura sp. NAK00032 TaxID=2742128 RepID=UPI0015913CF8|nr:hemerythrin domain-containing protein [Actinomadura sp. NAK00032]QKW38742.1 hemerythrin domain-containing protein [Actinomadura sp. NAK00032]